MSNRTWTVPDDWKELVSSELEIVLARRGVSHVRHFTAPWLSALANVPWPGTPDPWLSYCTVDCTPG